MKVAVMQPYFLPYLGYFQLLGAVDTFVAYDDIQYTKKGWINRNRFLLDGAPATFTLPLKGASAFLSIRDRSLAEDFHPGKLLDRLTAAYRKAPQFPSTFPLLERILLYPDRNLFRFILHSLGAVCAHLECPTPILLSSQVAAHSALKGQEKVLALCRAVGADTYLNPIGGVDLYAREAFGDEGIELRFLLSKPFAYPQFDAGFVPSLSILDVLMFNPPEVVQRQVLSGYELI